ncbi:MAG: hypothetical protein QG657_304 [Acidobacteriota bacterium]|nr:hypothetical protein [Acidobacteriota bacterium]
MIRFSNQGALFEKTAPWTPAKTFVNKSFGRCRNPFSKGF